MTRSPEDIEYEMRGIEYVMQSMMHRYNQLEKQHTDYVRDIFKREMANEKGFFPERMKRKSLCYCSYTAKGLEINLNCPQHGENIEQL